MSTLPDTRASRSSRGPGCLMAEVQVEGLVTHRPATWDVQAGRWLIGVGRI